MSSSVALDSIPTPTEVNAILDANCREMLLAVDNRQSIDAIHYNDYVRRLKAAVSYTLSFPVVLTFVDCPGGTYNKTTYNKFKADLELQYRVQDTQRDLFTDVGHFGSTTHVQHTLQLYCKEEE